MMRLVAIVFLFLHLLLSGCGQDSGSGTLTAAQFTDAYDAKLRIVDASLSVERKGALELLVSRHQTDGHRVFLDNAYKEYELAPEELDDVLDRYIQSVLEAVYTVDNDAVDIASIVPVIKDAAYPMEVRKSLIETGQKTDKLDFFYEKLNEHLLVFYALDRERSIRYLGREDIETLDLLPGELRTRAVKNLSGLLPEIEKHGDAGTFMVTAGGTYEASLILIDSIWSKDNFSVDGDIVVAIPSRDLLLITGSNDAEGLERLRTLAARTIAEGSYHLTPELFVRRDDKWLLFK